MGDAGEPLCRCRLRQGNQLTVGWTAEAKAGTSVGVHHLTIAPDGNLSGQWTSLPGVGQPQTERWEFLRPLIKTSGLGTTSVPAPK
jgi:hypothetical protein